MDIRIDPEFQSLIPPLADREYKQLEENILADGCRDALVLWDNTLVDGHNRYRICTENSVEYRTTAKEFESREDAIVWICKNQSGRRNLTQEQMAYLRGRQHEAEKVTGGRNQYTKSAERQNGAERKTSERIAAQYGVGARTIERDAKFARAIDTIGALAPEVKEQILSGKLHAKKKDVIALAEKPEQERSEAVEKIAFGTTVSDAIAEAPAQPKQDTKTCKRCGKDKPVADFESGRNVCMECRVDDGRGRSMCDIKGNPIKSTPQAEALMREVGAAVYRDITDLSREVRYGINEFIMEFNAIIQTFIRQSRESVDDHPELMGKPENRQKIIAALSEAETAINSLKEHLYE